MRRGGLPLGQATRFGGSPAELNSAGVRLGVHAPVGPLLFDWVGLGAIYEASPQLDGCSCRAFSVHGRSCSLSCLCMGQRHHRSHRGDRGRLGRWLCGCADGWLKAVSWSSGGLVGGDPCPLRNFIWRDGGRNEGHACDSPGREALGNEGDTARQYEFVGSELRCRGCDSVVM